MTLLLTLIFAVLVIALLAKIAMFRELVAAFIAAVAIIWLISTNGGDAHYWAPYVVGICMFLGVSKWVTGMFKKNHPS